MPLAPAFVILLVFFAGPIFYSLYIAFTNKALTGPGALHPKWIGLANFRAMFSDPAFVHSLLLTVIFVFFSAIVGQNLLGLALALLERKRNKVFTGVLNTVIIGAWATPEIVTAFAWYAYLYQGGTLDQFLRHLGLSQDWLYTAPMLAVILANIWRGTAFSMLVYSAGLSEVPTDLIEAAEVDGANQFWLLTRVIIPMLRRSIVTNLMVVTLQTLSSFTLIFVMTAGGPGQDSETTPLYIYQQAFQLYNISYGSAMCIILLLIGAMFSVVYLKAIKVEEQI